MLVKCQVGDILDKSDYVASITAINGVLNGGPGPYCLDLDNKSLKY